MLIDNLFKEKRVSFNISILKEKFNAFFDLNLGGFKKFYIVLYFFNDFRNLLLFLHLHYFNNERLKYQVLRMRKGCKLRGRRVILYNFYFKRRSGKIEIIFYFFC
jgi:hypothetical protein